MIKDEVQAIVGVDVGLSGGTVLLGLDRKILDVCFNYPGSIAYAELIDSWIEDFTIVHVLIENQHAFPLQGVSSTFTLGRGFGEVIGVFSAFKQVFSFIDPKVWQKEMFKGFDLSIKETKEKAARAVKHLFPDVSLLRTPRCTVPHDGAVDALLIAEYARKVYLTNKFDAEDNWLMDLPDKPEDFEFKPLTAFDFEE